MKTLLSTAPGAASATRNAEFRPIGSEEYSETPGEGPPRWQLAAMNDPTTFELFE